MGADPTLSFFHMAKESKPKPRPPRALGCGQGFGLGRLGLRFRVKGRPREGLPTLAHPGVSEMRAVWRCLAALSLSLSRFVFFFCCSLSLSLRCEVFKLMMWNLMRTTSSYNPGTGAQKTQTSQASGFRIPMLGSPNIRSFSVPSDFS